MSISVSLLFILCLWRSTRRLIHLVIRSDAYMTQVPFFTGSIWVQVAHWAIMDRWWVEIRSLCRNGRWSLLLIAARHFFSRLRLDLALLIVVRLPFRFGVIPTELVGTEFWLACLLLECEGLQGFTAMVSFTEFRAAFTGWVMLIGSGFRFPGAW